MRVSAILLATAIAQSASGGVPSPTRELTDPTSITSPALPGATPVPLADLDAVHSVRGDPSTFAPAAVWAPDGKSIVMSANLTGRFNLWRVFLDGRAPVQLTVSNDRQYPVAVLRNNRVLFQQDGAGNEMWDLYSVPLAGGAVANITKTPGQSETAFKVSPDERLVAMTTRAKTGQERELAVLDLTTGQSRQLTHGSGNRFWIGRAWSPDGHQLFANAVTAGRSSSAIHSFDPKTGTSTPVKAGSTGVLAFAEDISRDGRLLAITALAPTGQKRAAVLNLKTGKLRWAPPTPWEQLARSFSPDGTRLLVQENGDSRSRLLAYGVRRLEPISLALSGGTSEAADINGSWRPDGKALLAIHEAGDTPRDLWEVPITGQKPRRLTNLASANLNPTRLPASRVVTFRSSDGTLVSGIVAIPPNLARNGSNPGIAIVHGGPTAQSVDEFSALATALASRGFFVIRPNFRGSTGYGVAFERANRGDLGGGDLEDVVAAANFLAATGYVDPKRIGIQGSSYGGFMTLMALGKKPGVFAAGVAERPVLDWFMLWQNSEGGFREYQRTIMGDPSANRDAYIRQSPRTYVGAIKLPLLVMQGENDVRVPRNQTDELVRLIRAQGGVVEAVYFPSEGHGNYKLEHQQDARARTVAWFEKYLRAEPRVSH